MGNVGHHRQSDKPSMASLTLEPGSSQAANQLSWLFRDSIFSFRSSRCTLNFFVFVFVTYKKQFTTNYIVNLIRKFNWFAQEMKSEGLGLLQTLLLLRKQLTAKHTQEKSETTSAQNNSQ